MAKYLNLNVLQYYTDKLRKAILQEVSGFTDNLVKLDFDTFIDRSILDNKEYINIFAVSCAKEAWNDKERAFDLVFDVFIEGTHGLNALYSIIKSGSTRFDGYNNYTKVVKIYDNLGIKWVSSIGIVSEVNDHVLVAAYLDNTNGYVSNNLPNGQIKIIKKHRKSENNEGNFNYSDSFIRYKRDNGLTNSELCFSTNDGLNVVFVDLDER